MNDRVEKEYMGDIGPTGVRIPSRLKKQLKASAQENNRSLNAEIIDRLEKSFQQTSNAEPAYYEESTRITEKLNIQRELNYLYNRVVYLRFDQEKTHEVLKEIDEIEAKIEQLEQEYKAFLDADK